VGWNHASQGLRDNNPAPPRACWFAGTPMVTLGMRNRQRAAEILAGTLQDDWPRSLLPGQAYLRKGSYSRPLIGLR